MKAANRVIFNTGVLYTQLIIGMIIGLFTTRIVLNALGETDYGIYMLVASIVGMLGILNSNMANTSMRYMAHSLGTGDRETTLKTFNTTLFLHFIIGVIVILIMEAGGWIMFKYLINIPEAKVFDAKVVFHFMVITTFITVISVPYDAVMNSHENILALSLVDILGYILKLGVAIYLIYSNTNLLIIYGFLMLIIQILLRIIKQVYSKIKYDECKIRFMEYVDKKLMKSILSFTGWNLLGSIAAMSVTQVKGVLLNMFFGIRLNAAEGVSNTASSKVNMVSVSMTRALNPQLIKSEGSGNREKMLRITEIGTKYSSFLFALFAIPVLLEASFLFNLWLKTVPDYAIVFCQLTLVVMLIETFTFQINHAIRAVGNIRDFLIAESFIIILNVPIAYFAFKLGYTPITIYIIAISISLLSFFNRLYFGKKIAGINIKSYIKNAITPVLIPILLATVLAFGAHLYLSESFFRFFIVSLIFIITLTIFFWNLGLQIDEKYRLKSILFSTLKKRKKN